ncbi:ABC transporter permease, partial [Paenibacillus sp. 28ISP30-2]|nr:ABC transporter permease [Paenibacillus sp. 28ISP30-2]
MKLRYLILAVLVLAFASVFIGVHDITPLDLFHLTEDQAQVLLISRFPRLISIIIAGA